MMNWSICGASATPKPPTPPLTAQKTRLARGANSTPPPASYSLIIRSDQPLVSQLRHPDFMSGNPPIHTSSTPPRSPAHRLEEGVLLGSWLDGVVAWNQVTSSLTAITVIIVGVVNCFL